MNIKRKILFVSTFTLFLIGCSEPNSTGVEATLTKNVDQLIILKERLSEDCNKNIPKSCEQMQALVNVIDASVIQGVSVSSDSKEILRQWVRSHHATYSVNGKLKPIKITSKE